MPLTYLILETGSDRGLSLTPHDMLKGYVLANIADEQERPGANDRTRRDARERCGEPVTHSVMIATCVSDLVAEHNAEMEQFNAVPSPQVLGMLPPGPPPDDPISRAVIKMFGGDPLHSESADTLHGAAIVTDAGAILSQCAVVAREYSIPAAVDATRATAALRDGQLVEIDGNTGAIRKLGG